MATVPTAPVDESVTNDALEMGWRTLAAAGAIVATLGALAIIFPLATGLSLTLVFGFLLVIAGVAHGGHAVAARSWRGMLWQTALAAVSIIAGVLVLANPAIGLASLTVLLVAYLIVDGVAELAVATRMASGRGRQSIAVSGILSLALGGLLWAGFPGSAAWALGVVVGVSLLATGVSMLLVASGGRAVLTEFDNADLEIPGEEQRTG